MEPYAESRSSLISIDNLIYSNLFRRTATAPLLLEYATTSILECDYLLFIDTCCDYLILSHPISCDFRNGTQNEKNRQNNPFKLNKYNKMVPGSPSIRGAATSKALRVGMFGGGTVGGGVYELVMGRLRQQRQQQHRESGSDGRQLSDPKIMTRPMIITKICVKNLSKSRSFHLDESITTLTTNIDSILEDDTIEMVVEVMDSSEIDLAKKVTERALAKHKSVVTANKAMLAEHLDELSALLSQLQRNYATNKHSSLHSTVGIGYEAAVCGGIPIIHTLQSSCYVGDVIHQIQGICNGATNFMLCKMEQNGMDYAAAFREARELGYLVDDVIGSANGDEVCDILPSPSADVDGLDARDKICLLAKLAFGVTVPPRSVPCKGISRLTSVDFEYAKLLKCTIKLLGTARRLHYAREWDGALCVYVSPVMLPLTHELANVKSNGNAIAITSANMGTCSYIGPGSGRFPTANSIVADMSRLCQARTFGTTPPPPFPTASQQKDGMLSPVEIDYDFVSAFYIRIPYADGLGIIKRVGELCEEYEISIHSVLQNPIRDRMSADFCITTEDDCKQSQVEALCEAVSQEYFCRAPCLWMPLLFG